MARFSAQLWRGAKHRTTKTWGWHDVRCNFGVAPNIVPRCVCLHLRWHCVRICHSMCLPTHFSYCFCDNFVSFLFCARKLCPKRETSQNSKKFKKPKKNAKIKNDQPQLHPWCRRTRMTKPRALVVPAHQDDEPAPHPWCRRTRMTKHRLHSWCHPHRTPGPPRPKDGTTANAEKTKLTSRTRPYVS